MTPPCEPMNMVPCWSEPSKASSRSASTYRVSPAISITCTSWPPCPNITVPEPSTVISGVASFATRRPIIEVSPPWPPWILGVNLTCPVYASIAPRWLNIVWPGSTCASAIFELSIRNGI